MELRPHVFEQSYFVEQCEQQLIIYLLDICVSYTCKCSYIVTPYKPHQLLVTEEWIVSHEIAAKKVVL